MADGNTVKILKIRVGFSQKLGRSFPYFSASKAAILFNLPTTELLILAYEMN